MSYIDFKQNTALCVWYLENMPCCLKKGQYESAMVFISLFFYDTQYEKKNMKKRLTICLSPLLRSFASNHDIKAPVFHLL